MAARDLQPPQRQNPPAPELTILVGDWTCTVLCTLLGPPDIRTGHGLGGRCLAFACKDCVRRLGLVGFRHCEPRTMVADAERSRRSVAISSHQLCVPCTCAGGIAAAALRLRSGPPRNDDQMRIASASTASWASVIASPEPWSPKRSGAGGAWQSHPTDCASREPARVG